MPTNKYEQRMIELNAAFIHSSQGLFPSRVLESDIDAIEQKIGVQLPSDYREFLADYGMSFFRFGAIFPLADEEGSISVFYSAQPDENYGLVENRFTYQEFDQRISMDLLPIGDEGSGNQICLAVSGNNSGAIYFWNSTPVEKHSNLHLIVDSFDKFMSLLKVDTHYEQSYGELGQPSD